MGLPASLTPLFMRMRFNVLGIKALMAKMNKAFFMFYNIIGSVCWVASMMLGGYFLNNWFLKKFDISLQEHIEVITITIILITTLPVLYKIFFGKKDEEETNPETPNL